MSKCPDCTYENNNLIGLSVHYRKTHHKSAEQLRIEVFHNGIRPTCGCGCGGEVRFCGFKVGFSDYVLGHYSRVNNNWGHNVDAQQKSQDVRRKMHERGEIKIWNKGETKETDERVAAYGLTGSLKLKTDPTCQKQRSDHMIEQWETGNLSPLFGKDHPNWKGGASVLQPIVRSRLHAPWVYPKLKSSGFRCSACGTPGPGLEVHHDKERFAAILQQAIAVFGEVDVSAPDDDFEKKSSIADWVVAYHVRNDVSGVVLCHQKLMPRCS